MVQTEPFQCKISALGSVRLVGCCVPTAQTSLAATAVTPRRVLSTSGPTFGLGITLQTLPFQCNVSVASSSPMRLLPTAQISLAEITASAARLFKGMLLGGLGTTVQAVPSQCRIRAGFAVVAALPTAQTLLAATAATPSSLLIDELGLGLETTDH